MNLLSIRIILLQTALLATMCISSNLLAADRDIATAQEIMAARDKIAEFRISQSFFESAYDITAVTGIGTILGALVGCANAGLSTENDLGVIIFQGLLLTAQGATSALALGVASHSGSLPQLDKKTTALILASQAAVSLVLAILADRSNFKSEEKFSAFIASQIVATFFVTFPTIISIIYARKNLGKTKQSLKDTLKELEKSLNEN